MPCPFMSANPGTGALSPASFIAADMASALAATLAATHWSHCVDAAGSITGSAASRIPLRKLVVTPASCCRVVADPSKRYERGRCGVTAIASRKLFTRTYDLCGYRIDIVSDGVFIVNRSPGDSVSTSSVAAPERSAISVYGTPPVLLSSVKVSTELAPR